MWVSTQPSPVFHQVECVENVEVCFLGEDEGVSHEVCPRRDGGDVVEGVCSLDGVVSWMVHHGAGQSVEADEVCQLAWAVWILHNEALDDVWLRSEPVENVGRVEDWCEVKPEEIIIEQLSHIIHVCRSELSNALKK